MYSKMILLFLMAFQFGSCNLFETKEIKNKKDEELNQLYKDFAKAICTKDTIMFYDLVDENKLTKSMNNWVRDTKQISSSELYFPFFFVYSPLKIKKEELIEARQNNNFFIKFEIENIKILNEKEISATLKWVQVLSNQQEQSINITTQKNKTWKVIEAHWQTL